MVFFLKMKMTQVTLGRSGGALLGLLSLGLHGLVLSLPVPHTGPPDLDPLAEQTDPIEAIAVVRLPSAPLPDAEPPQAIAPPPVVAPPAPANPPTQAVAPSPDPSIPKPAPPEASVPPEPAPPAPPEAPLEITLEERLRDPAEYTYNQEVKSLVANELNLHTAVVPDWLDAEGQGLSDDAAPVMGTKLAPLQVVYPINSCLMPPPAEGLVGVIVTQAGQLAKAPILLDTTGYTVLDEKALELALERAFVPLPAGSDAPTNPRAHWLPVQVQYDSGSCGP